MRNEKVEAKPAVEAHPGLIELFFFVVSASLVVAYGLSAGL